MLAIANRRAVMDVMAPVKMDALIHARMDAEETQELQILKQNAAVGLIAVVFAVLLALIVALAVI